MSSKQLFLFLFGIVISCQLCFAKKIEDRYIVKTLQSGLLFFIEPFEIPACSKGDAGLFDITYIIQQDTAIINMSLFLPQMISADSIVFTGLEHMSICAFETFYIDTYKGKFKHRYSCKVPYSMLCRLYRSDQPYMVSIYEKTRVFHYGYKTKDWPKERNWMNQILLIIDKNKKSL